MKVWRQWATDVRGHGIDAGHHVAEEAPEALASSLASFFAGLREGLHPARHIKGDDAVLEDGE